MGFDYKIEVTYQLNELKQRIYEKKKTLDSYRPIAPYILDRLRDDFTLEWTYNSNHIEGNTLTIAETRMILESGMTVGGKSLREHFEVINHEKAIRYLEGLVDKKETLRTIDLLHIHELVMSNIMDDFAGRLRPGMVRIVGANFTPPNARKVRDLLDALIDMVKDNERGHDILTLATLFHHRFVWIHPFNDGNGRTVRLAMNLLLMREGFPPCFILSKDRKKYYAALNQANNGNYQKLLLMMFQAMERSLNIYLSSIGGNYEDYLSTATLAKDPEVPYGQEYLSLLARRGRIDAYKEGRAWLTTKTAIKQYQKKKQK